MPLLRAGKSADTSGIVAEGLEAAIDASRSGDQVAVALIYRALYPRLLRYFVALEPSEAEDLASETWLDIATGLPRFVGDEQALGAWAFTIARRRLGDHRRKGARRATAPVEPSTMHLIGPTGDAEQEAEAELATAEAIRMIGKLPPDQAEVILLRVLGDLPAAEVAKIVGKREGAVRVLQHRGLKRLAEGLEREGVTN
jgi:RNA polymerase sigma-70 factor, ECF subfamily